MKRIHFMFLAVAIIVLFIMSLTVFSVMEYQMELETLKSEAQIAVMQAEGEDNQVPTPSPTPTPTPTPIPVYIPGNDDLLPLPDLEEMEFIAEGFEVTETEDYEGEPALLGEWAPIDNVDYYLVYIDDESGEEYICFQILFSSTNEWLFIGDLPYTILVLGFSDHAVEGMEDDILEGAYMFERERPQTPTPTSTPTSTTHTPTPTPARVSSDGVTTEYLVIVDKGAFAFAIFKMDENDEHTIRLGTYPAALGRGSSTPTGTYSLGARRQWRDWRGSMTSPFATTYRSGLYFHGPLYRSRDRGDLIEDRYAEFGQNTTGGCVRTTIAGAMAIYNLPRGTTVHIVNSSDRVSWPGFPAIDTTYAPKWDPTDPHPDRPRGPAPTNADNNADTDTDTDTDSNANTDTDTDTDSNANTDTDTNTDTHTDRRS